MIFDTPIHTNQHSLDRVLKAGLPVIVVFWKNHCAPCQQLEPSLNRLARDYAGKLLIAKVDVNMDGTLLKRFDINALPGILMVKRGQVVARSAGAASYADLQRWADYLIRGGSQPPLPTGATISVGSARPRATSSKPVHLTDASFDSAIRQATTPVLVDFWAQWCGPCHRIAPAVEALAQEFAGKLLVAKLNVDENPRTAARYNIMSIPSLLIFNNGQVVDQIVGALPAPALRQRVMRHVR